MRRSAGLVAACLAAYVACAAVVPAQTRAFLLRADQTIDESIGAIGRFGPQEFGTSSAVQTADFECARAQIGVLKVVFCRDHHAAVTRAQIRLNGTKVLMGHEYKAAFGTKGPSPEFDTPAKIVAPVQLEAGTNSLRVDLRGSKPESCIRLSIVAVDSVNRLPAMVPATLQPAKDVQFVPIDVVAERNAVLVATWDKTTRSNFEGTKLTLNGVPVVDRPHFQRIYARGGKKMGEVRLPIRLNTGANLLGVRLNDVENTPMTFDVLLPRTTPEVDATPPSTAASSIQLTGTSVRPDGKIVVRGGSSTVDTTADTDGRFTIDVPLASNKLNRLFVHEDFGAGRESPSTPVSIVQDSTPPKVFIDFPGNGDELTSPTTTVSGRVSDLLSGFMGLTVSVNGIAATVNEGLGTNGTFEALGIPLTLNQDTTIVATATDKLGNAATTSIAVRRIELTGPRMAIVSGNGQSTKVNRQLPTPIVVRVTQENGTPIANKIVNFEVVRSNGRLTPAGTGAGALELQTLTDNDGQASVWWRLGSDAGCGNNRVRVTSTSISGSTFFCASALPEDPAQINVGSGHGQRSEAGKPAPERLRSWVSDACNGVPGVPVTFTVVSGSALLVPPGPGVLGPQFTIATASTGHASIAVIPGVGNSRVEANFASNPAGRAVFNVFGIARDPDGPTSFVGVVLDNAQQPIQGADCHVTVAGQTSATVKSDVNGLFRIDNLTATGAGTLSVDGLTATHVGGTGGRDVPVGSYPSLHFDIEVIPGAQNSLTGAVLLPALDPRNAKTYDGTQDVVLTVEGVSGLQMVIRAGSMRLANGDRPSPSAPAIVALNQVHADKVPMPMPDGASPPFAWTLQPAGATFDPPVEVRYPNMSGLPPGAIAYFLSFNHDTNEFSIVATGSVSADGLAIATDPGSGIETAGWGCNCPPYSVTAECENCEDLQNACIKAEASGEIAFATNLLKSALQKIPFVDDPSISGSISAETCPICCNGDELFPGTIKFQGSLTGSLTVSKTLSPWDFGPRKFCFDFLGSSYCVIATLELGPKIAMTPSLTVQATGTRNLCTKKNCFELAGCGSVQATVSLVADATVKLEKNGEPEGTVGVKATGNVTTTAAAVVKYRGADCPEPGTLVDGCLGDVVGTIDLEVFGFKLLDGLGPFVFATFTKDCGCSLLLK